MVVIKSKLQFFLALTLGMSIAMSVVIVVCNNAVAQTLETILEQKKRFENSPQIILDSKPRGIAINEITNKIYITSPPTGTVYVIDSNSGGAAKKILVGSAPGAIAVDSTHNKIYVANEDSNTVSVIDGNRDSEIKQIPVGQDPSSIVVGYDESTTEFKIYVANRLSDTVSVIHASNDSKETNDIAVGDGPLAMVEERDKLYVVNSRGLYHPENGTVSVIDEARDIELTRISVGKSSFAPNAHPIEAGMNKIYVANSLSDTVSVIHASNDSKESNDIAVGYRPNQIASLFFGGEIYVANTGSNTVSEINGDDDKKEPYDIAVGEAPDAIVGAANKVFVANALNNTVSVIKGNSDSKETNDLAVGDGPSAIAAHHHAKMIYVANWGSSSVSVINAVSDKVAAGVRFNIDPANSGKIVCDSKDYPTNIYLYIDARTKCTAKPNEDFEFSGWTENLDRNSIIPLSDSSENLIVNRYGNFTANFKPLPSTIPTEFLVPLYAIVVSSLVGWSLPNFIGWIKARTQRKYLRECLNDVDKLHKNELDKGVLEEKITAYYVEGKISEFHHQLLKDKTTHRPNKSTSQESPR